MKDKLFKYALVVVLSSMAYFAIAAYDKKDACASGECIEIVSVAFEFIGAIAAIMDGDVSQISALSFIGQYIKGIKDKIEAYTQFYKDMLKTEAEETKEMMQKIAQEHRQANIAVAGQRMNLKEAAAMIKKTTRYQRSQVDTVARRFPAPSDRVCRQTNQMIRENQAENFSTFEQAVHREQNRIRNNHVLPRDDYSTQSLTRFGPVVYGAMMASITKRRCFSDEHLGNTGLLQGRAVCDLAGDWGLASNKSEAMTYGSSLTSDMPFDHMGEALSVGYIKELIFTPHLMSPLPKAVLTDKSHNSYMMLNSKQTRTNLDEAIVDYLIARRTPMKNTMQQWSGQNTDPLYPGPNGHVRACQRAYEMVRQTYNEVYGHPLLFSVNPQGYGNDQCPSEQTLDHATTMSVSSSAGLGAMLAQEEGNMKQSSLYVSILRQRLEFNAYQKEQMIALQQAINGIGAETGNSVKAPFSSIGTGEPE